MARCRPQPHRTARHPAHELIHAERGIPTCDGGPLAEREEAIVRAETARRLVPAAELAPWAARRVEAGHQVTVGDVAAEWDVTPEVAREAIRQMVRRSAT